MMGFSGEDIDVARLRSVDTSTNEDALRKGATRCEAGGGDRPTLAVRTTGPCRWLALDKGFITTSWPSKVKAESLEFSSVSALTLSDVTISG